MKLVSLFAAGTLAAVAADPAALVVDRGLPQANWNNAAGVAERSNVRWTLYEQGFVADEFRLGEPGEKWVVDRIRVWAVPGAKGVDPAALGDFYSRVQLFAGPAEGDLQAIASADLAPGSSEGSAKVRILNGVMEGAPLYDDFGAHYRIWQLDFENLEFAAEGGRTYRFGSLGTGREGQAWFTHGANAAKSASRQDGADGKLFLYDTAGKFASEYVAGGETWNKTADLNVQVFAHLDAEVALVDGQLVIRGALASQIDPSTVRINGRASRGFALRNGNQEMVFSGATQGCLTANRFDGTPVRGCVR
ncbi:MAG: hypothetical protein NTX13_03415 [Acidobacteria bacterium]|nr:hypothetical protein [Acidobacteriota bacterium]